jgi:hypothetical protein
LRGASRGQPQREERRGQSIAAVHRQEPRPGIGQGVVGLQRELDHEVLFAVRVPPDDLQGQVLDRRGGLDDVAAR